MAVVDQGAKRAGLARAGSSREQVLVGRDGEFAAACAALRAERSVVLHGAAGVGKTFLAQALVDVLAEERELVVWIAATEASRSIPYGAIASLLPPRARFEQAHDSTPLRAALETVERRTIDRKALVVVDDAHHLDPGSAMFVHLVATSGTAPVLLALRAGEPVPDPVVALWKDAGARYLDIEPLDRSAATELLEHALGGRVDGRTRERLLHVSNGNPLYLRQLVSTGLELGNLRADDGLWHWSGPIRPDERLVQLIERRIGHLPPDAREALELLAVGEPVSGACVERLGVAEEIEQLIRGGVARDTTDGEIALAHPLFGETVRSRIPSLGVARIQSRLADAMDDVIDTSRDTDRFRVALWRAQTGDSSHPDELRWAARRALVLWDAGNAELFARLLLRVAPDLEAHYLLAQALRGQRRGVEAVAVCEATESMPGREAVRAQVADVWSSTLVQLLGRRDEARTMLWSVFARLREPEPRQRVLGNLLSDGLATVDEIAPHLSDGALSPNTSFGLALDALLHGRCGSALDTVRAVLATEPAWRDDAPTVGVVLRLVEIWTLAISGDPLTASNRCADLYRDAVRTSADYPRGAWCLARGMVAVLCGDMADGVAALLEARSALEALDPNLLRPVNAYLAMGYAAGRGGTEKATRAIDAAEGASRILDHVFGAEVTRATAWLHAADGDLARARAVARNAADAHRASGAPVLELLALHDVARFGDAVSVADRIDEIAAGADSELATMLADYARAVRGADALELLAVAARLAEHGFGLYAAEAAAQAVAHAQLHLGEAHVAIVREHAASLRARVGDASTPSLVLPERTGGLTDREREVVLLASNGRTSRAIAEHLGIAVRTVDNLLGRAYMKLGVSGRAELATAVGDLGRGPALEY